jgi:hypothetical protein
MTWLAVGLATFALMLAVAMLTGRWLRACQPPDPLVLLAAERNRLCVLDGLREMRIADVTDATEADQWDAIAADAHWRPVLAPSARERVRRGAA